MKVKHAELQRVTQSRTISSPFQRPADVEQLTLSLLDPLFPVTKGTRLIGVTVSTLDDMEVSDINSAQLPLL